MPHAAAQAAADQALRTAARQALACLDLTSLNDGDTDDTIAALAARANGPAGPPAALCVWPRFVAKARALAPAGVAVAAVANFPDGALDTPRALADTRRIVADGGDEVDLVLPWRALVAGDAAGVAALVQAVRQACPQQRLKLIIESGELQQPALIQAACRIGLEVGVDFLKTSTGKTATGATPEAARLMLQAIAQFAPERLARFPGRPPVGFKASGGIRRVADAAAYTALACQVLGPDAATPQRLRFGASGLLDDIEAVLAGQATPLPIPPGGY